MKLMALLNKNGYSFYASFFRVLIGIILLVDVIFNTLSLVWESAEFNVLYMNDFKSGFLSILSHNLIGFLIIYLIVLYMFIIGIGKRLTSLMILIFYVIHILLSGLNFWGDYILLYTLTYFVLVDSFKFFTINKSIGDSFISKIGVLAIQFHVCYIYLINAINKLQHAEWVNGSAIANFFKFESAVDKFALGEFVIQNNLSPFLSYSVAFFQFTFMLFIWFKKTKYLMMVLGIIIHIFMAFTLQVYKFEIIVILHYGFFISDKEWNKFIPWINIK